MRIGIEAQRLQRTKKHGMDIVALELVRALQRLNSEHEFFVFVKTDADREAVQSGKGVTVVEIPGGPYPYWEQVLLPRVASRYQLDVLHCTANTAPLFTRIPLLLHLHDIIFLERFDLQNGSWYQRIGNLYRRLLVPRLVPKVREVLTVSDYENQVIRKFFGLGDKVQTVYNGVGDHFKPVAASETAAFATKHQLPEAFVLFLGNTDPKKNTEGMLRALDIAEKKYGFSPTLVMLDLDRAYLQSLLDKIGNQNLASRIRLTGYLPNRELPLLMNRATIYVYPSLRESFGIPPLEAMGCGLPVIASNTSSMPEVCGDAALSIDPFQPETIADAMYQLWHEKELQRALRAKGLERVKQFSWDQMARRMLEIYERQR